MRLSLLREGVAWCERAMNDADRVHDRIRARLNYTLSMLYHNLGMDERALVCAQRAVEDYERVGDKRGLTRALSQVAYENAACGRPEDAALAAERALQMARESRDRRLLAATLQRCAMVTETKDIEITRGRYAEAIAIFRELSRTDEMARATLWWADDEAAAGFPERAIEIATGALEDCPIDLRLFATNGMAGWYLAIGDSERALPLARESLRLARDAGHELARLGATLYLAALTAPERADLCAQIAGYIDEQCVRLGWTLLAHDELIFRQLRDNVRAVLGEMSYGLSSQEGSRWSEREAISFALQL
jgi:tetratricopeptide (TPR) repeat protein